MKEKNLYNILKIQKVNLNIDSIESCLSYVGIEWKDNNLLVNQRIIISPEIMRSDKRRGFSAFLGFVRSLMDRTTEYNDFTAVILDATAEAHARQARAY